MIALIDCNNFYVSCERLFQPLLIGRPLIVLSNNDGCAISRSDEAKSLGIKMGTAHFMIDELIKQHNVEIRSSNYSLYGDMSQRVMQVIKSFVPQTEVYSIDEIFCNLTDFKEYNNLTELCNLIKATIKQYTGIPVSIGIAPTKVLAKMANRYAKKQWIESGIYCADTRGAIDRMLKLTPVGDIWGIGKEYEMYLKARGFTTAADLATAPEEWVRKELSVKGQRLQTELRGTPCIEFVEVKAPKKAIATTRSFGKLIKNKKDVQQALASHTANCGAKLRRERACARRLHVFIQTDNFRTQDNQYAHSITLELPVATNSTPELIRYALKALDLIYKDGHNYKKTGVIAMELVPEPAIQMGLFDGINRKKEEKLMQVLDNINVSYGKDTVRYSVQGYGKAWKLRQAYLSPCYTTRFDHIKEVS